MKIGAVTDSLAHLPFDEMLETAANLGLAGVEVNTGNWSSAPHCDLRSLLTDAAARKDFVAAIADRGLELFALNANGNQLHPTDVMLSRLDGMRESVDLLRIVAPDEASDFTPQDI